MHVRTVYGIVPGENGRYVMVSLRMGKPERARIGVRRWNIDDKLQTLRLLHRGVYCGVPSLWKTADSRTGPEILAVDAPNQGFTPWTNRIAAEVHAKALSDNLLALVPEDSYLCCVPLFYGDPSLHSFISVHSIPADEDRQGYFKIGIILNKVLIAVFALAPGTRNALEFHLGRIRRFFARTHQGIDFPEHLYVLGSREDFSIPHFICRPLSPRIGKRTVDVEDELKGLGCALARSIGTVPVFLRPSKSSGARYFRSAAWIASVAIIIATGFAACAPVVANIFLKRELQSRLTQYRSLIKNNPDIQTAIMRNDSLSASITRMSGKSGQRTVWGKFLQSLGAERPMGLFYEKLGSEPAGSTSHAVRIAISGISQGETMVTDLISRLQNTGIISNISLTSMEKNKTKPTICDFKIICTLMITGQ